MRYSLGFLFIFYISHSFVSQNYTAYRTGNSAAVATLPAGGICLMGGGGENDEGMKWFLQQASGGDVLILRTSGSDGYNDYFYSDLGVSVNSVETIVCHNAQASTETYIWDRINEAEAIWFAGGDQWQYISFWRDSPIDSLINKGIQERNLVVGGTSAGMAIQGQYYFSAQNGTITSNEALTNPFNTQLTLSGQSFIQHSILTATITDTHFDNPDRKGRLTTFLARMYHDDGIRGYAIACDEYTAVCIDNNGIARVFGDYPTYDDHAYFIQTNCAIHDISPEILMNGTPLTWDKNGEALLTYTIKGNALGTNRFNLNDWKTGSGGNWEKWSVSNGIFHSAPALPIQCESLNTLNQEAIGYLQAQESGVRIEFHTPFTGNLVVQNIAGQVMEQQFLSNTNSASVESSHLPSGMYIILVDNQQQTTAFKWMITR